MLAFEGTDPVGVLIAAKRARASFIHRIGVKRKHRLRSHARHMFESLARKMAFPEPRTLFAEVPTDSEAALRVFEACGYASVERASATRAPGPETSTTQVAEVEPRVGRAGERAPQPKK
jgi:ribosomal protein S18 acetylase RimI-like enzyme